MIGILAGLDYLHSVCRVAHNDLRLDNILVSSKTKASSRTSYRAHLTNTMEYKIDSAGRHIFRRHNDFGLLDSFDDALSIAPVIADFGTAIRLNPGERGVYSTQSRPLSSTGSDPRLWV